MDSFKLDHKNDFELNYKSPSDITIKMNDKEVGDISAISLGMRPGDTPVLAVTFDLSNITLKLADVDLAVELHSSLPSELQNAISKKIKKYYLNEKEEM